MSIPTKYPGIRSQSYSTKRVANANLALERQDARARGKALAHGNRMTVRLQVIHHGGYNL